MTLAWLIAWWLAHAPPLHGSLNVHGWWLVTLIVCAIVDCG